MDMSSAAPYMYQPFGAGTQYEEGLSDFGGYFDTANPLGAIDPTPLRYDVSMDAIAREMDLCPPGTLPLPDEQAWDGPNLPLLPPYKDYDAPAPRTVAEDDQIPPELQRVLDEYAYFTHTWTPNFDGMDGVAPCDEQLLQLLPPPLPSGSSSRTATGPTYGVATKGRYRGMYVEIPKALPPLGKTTRSTAKKDTPKTVQTKAQEKAQGKAQEKKKTRSSIQKQAVTRYQQKNQSKVDHITRCRCKKCNELIQDTASSRGRHERYHCPFGKKFVPTCPDCHESPVTVLIIYVLWSDFRPSANLTYINGPWTLTEFVASTLFVSVPKPQLLCGSYMNICLNSLKYCTSFLTRPVLAKQRPRWFSASPYNAHPQTRHEPTLRQAHAQRRLQISKIYSMLVQLSKRIPDLEHDHDQLEKWVVKRLSSQEFTGKYLPRAYEEAIRFLMSERYYAEAVVLYRRMLDQGLLPSSATNSTITALSVAAAGASGSDLLKALEVTLTDPQYTESSLLQLLDFLAKLLLPSTLRMQIARRFVESRAEDYTPSMELVTRLVMLQAKDGLLRESLDWIVRGNDDERPVATTRESARLYKQLLSHLKTTKPDDSEAVDTILSHMKSNKVPVSTSVFNMLISMQARRGASSQAFSLYNVLVEVSKSQPLYPDSFTFGTLFSLIQSLRSPGNRNARRRRFKEAANVLPPRTLYQHLLHYGKRDIRTHVVTLSILNVALRTFLTVRDYAAAFVVIRTFPTLQLHPNRDTYYVVMKLLMDRIRYDLWQARNPKEARWGDHMLGIDPVDAPTTTVDDSLAETVLAFGKQLGGRPIRMPTLAQIDNEEEIPTEDAFDTLPLERILKRAILADMMLQGHTVALSSSVSGAIARAKEEMVTPPDIILRKTDFRRKRRR